MRSQTYLSFDSIISILTTFYSEMPYLSEPNPELTAQFEKEDAERKAARANRDTQINTGGLLVRYRYRTGYRNRTYYGTYLPTRVADPEPENFHRVV